MNARYFLIGSLSLTSAVALAQTPLSPMVNDKSDVIVSATTAPSSDCWKAQDKKPNEYALSKVKAKCLDATDLKVAKVVQLPDGTYQVDGLTVGITRVVGPAGEIDLKKPIDQGPFVVVYESNGKKVVVRTKEIVPAKKPEPQLGQEGEPGDKAKLRAATSTASATFAKAPGKCWKKAKDPDEYELLNASNDCVQGLDLPLARRVELDDTGQYWIDGQVIKLRWILGKDGPIADTTKPFDAAPYLLADDKGKLLRATAITHKKPEYDTCAWPTAEGNTVHIDLPRRAITKSPPRSVIGTNQGLVVLVCHDTEQDITVQWGGTRGLTTSTVGKSSQGTSHGGSDNRQGFKPVELSQLRFAPRQAGTADLKVFEGTDTTKTPEFIAELEVEARFWGSVRFGLGTLLGGVGFDDWKSHAVTTFSGSRQQELRESTNNTTFELVSGFAPYPEALFERCGGRSHSGGGCNVHVAPFIGFGVLGTTPDKGVDGLTSFHAGVEFEFASNFSIAITYVRRKIRVLGDGYTNGSPVAMGFTVDNVTTDSWANGFAVVVNASPEFLQFATGKTKAKGDGN